MLDKIVISRSENKATMIFTDRAPFTLSTDQDIVMFLLWFLDSLHVKLVTDLNGRFALIYVND